MRKRQLKNVAHSVHQRLLNKARDSDRPFNEVLQYYGMERFLYRLSVSPYVDRFVLKGALMFTVWDASETRPTRDVDLLGRMRAVGARAVLVGGDIALVASVGKHGFCLIFLHKPSM